MMKVIKYPKRETWQNLCQRAQIERKTLTSSVADILETVKLKGDRALLDFTEKFDGVALDSLVVQPEEITEAKTKVSTELKEAIVLAKNNIERFHKSQQSNEKKVETIEGVVCWRKSVAIEKVGLYIPGGSAPLFSTILMLAIPARIAGCKEIVLLSLIHI